ncbi:hypothetical protein JT739_10470 [Tepidanaerobacter sp. GT38]|uniref:flavoprotein n=1 Tax=Tepidanaerobacter sp. GT38 TaxID=2722793 RepID=UPI001F36C4C7|nr:flavoprotein [Tepidanaerobacter sp. GT38]MCG1013015.1 hypothetical protein [Tepidanaerobacter sp. GT38]
MDNLQLEQRIKALVEETVMRIMKGRLLVVVTGGTIGAETALKELEESIKHNRIDVDVMMSAAASKIHDALKIKERLSAGKIYIEGRERIQNLKDYTGVIVAVLSRNTAAKVANLILDSYASELMIDALMLGIPVIAAKDAADVEGPQWSRLGFNWPNAHLKGAFARNLSVLKDYGVKLCAADSLGDMVQKVMFCQRSSEMTEDTHKTCAIKVDKNPVTRKDILPYLNEGREISIPKSALITPLAQDLIRDFGLKIIRE